MGFDGKIPQGGLIIYHINNDASYTTEGYPGQAGWPENGRHYRVAVLQKDGKYDMEKNSNRGDSGDVWHSSISGIGPSTSSSGPYPNTDSYQGGNIEVTSIRIYDISESGPTMTFKVEIPSPSADPTNAPIAPTDAPASADPTNAPIADPTDAPASADPTNAPIAPTADAPASADPTNAPIAPTADAPASADPTNAPIAP